MKKRFELPHESTKGLIRNTQSLMDSWTNMWTHEKEQTSSMKEYITTENVQTMKKDQSIQTDSYMKNSNTFKDDDRYPMHLTMSDDQAMQLNLDHKFTLTDLIIHKLGNESAEYCNGPRCCWCYIQSSIYDYYRQGSGRSSEVSISEFHRCSS